MEELISNKSPPWNEEELEKVLKNLKNNKTRDPVGMINKNFKPGCAGKDLRLALLYLLNGILLVIFIIQSKYKDRHNKEVVFLHKVAKSGKTDTLTSRL